MPPFQSRSTGAARIALTTSFGVIELSPDSRPSAARAWAERVMDFSEREKTPPPAEMSASS
ncbi:unannotated protein [freshwater metagenome]|uniref:Unannotated protein n=1 Tax=freshwater metagenome TaxID=449393 RepID=A0A6J7AKX7_9ZZZZ